MTYRYSDKDIKYKVEIAISILFDIDNFLLKNDAHERSVSHKLAEYLQILFSDWNVDCEYNLMGFNSKVLKGINECSEQRKTDRVLPDIIIHKRNSKKNLLVIELKTINKDIKCDIKKLELFTLGKGSYRYKLGLLIIFDKLRKPEYKWYKNGKETKI